MSPYLRHPRTCASCEREQLGETTGFSVFSVDVFLVFRCLRYAESGFVLWFLVANWAALALGSASSSSRLGRAPAQIHEPRQVPSKAATEQVMLNLEKICT